MKTLVSTDPKVLSVIPDLLNDFLADEFKSLNRKPSEATLPAINVRETNDEFVIEFAVPGMKKEDFKIELDNDVLIVASQVDKSQEEKNNFYSRMEFNYGTFYRSFTLPKEKIDGDKIAATYSEGILSVHVPKKEQTKVKPVRQIRIG